MIWFCKKEIPYICVRISLFICLMCILWLKSLNCWYNFPIVGELLEFNYFPIVGELLEFNYFPIVGQLLEFNTSQLSGNI